MRSRKYLRKIPMRLRKCLRKPQIRLRKRLRKPQIRLRKRLRKSQIRLRKRLWKLQIRLRKIQIRPQQLKILHLLLSKRSRTLYWKLFAEYLYRKHIQETVKSRVPTGWLELFQISPRKSGILLCAEFSGSLLTVSGARESAAFMNFRFRIICRMEQYLLPASPAYIDSVIIRYSIMPEGAILAPFTGSSYRNKRLIPRNLSGW